MSYRPGAHASVVVDVADLAAAAGVFEIVEGQAVVVTFDMAIALSHPPAGRLLLGKMRGRRGHRPASSGPARDLDHIRVCLSRPPRPRFTECDPKAVLPAMVSGDAACGDGCRRGCNQTVGSARKVRATEIGVKGEESSFGYQPPRVREPGTQLRRKFRRSRSGQCKNRIDGSNVCIELLHEALREVSAPCSAEKAYVGIGVAG